jgi:hypothetical protein
VRERRARAPDLRLPREVHLVRARQLLVEQLVGKGLVQRPVAEPLKRLLAHRRVALAQRAREAAELLVGADDKEAARKRRVPPGARLLHLAPRAVLAGEMVPRLARALDPAVRKPARAKARNVGKVAGGLGAAKDDNGVVARVAVHQHERTKRRAKGLADGHGRQLRVLERVWAARLVVVERAVVLKEGGEDLVLHDTDGDALPARDVVGPVAVVEDGRDLRLAEAKPLRVRRRVFAAGAADAVGVGDEVERDQEADGILRGPVAVERAAHHRRRLDRQPPPPPAGLVDELVQVAAAVGALLEREDGVERKRVELEGGEGRCGGRRRRRAAADGERGKGQREGAAHFDHERAGRAKQTDAGR